ncbi:MAG: DnaJ domain-containing protein [Chloroherpetonaceae bacterium]|nr:DnaJ domain-containing protein [Chloroherpetonaceae bacterium]
MNRDDFIDLYAELGLTQNATEAEIKRAYTERIKEVHPDRLQNASEQERKRAEEKSQRLNQAKEILLDPDKRFRYDNLYREKLSEAVIAASEYGFDGRRYNDYAQDIARFRAERDERLKARFRYRPLIFLLVVMMAGLSLLWRLVKPEQIADFAKPNEVITLSEPIYSFKVGAQAYELAVSENHCWVASENNCVKAFRKESPMNPIHLISLDAAPLSLARKNETLAIGDKSGTLTLANLTDGSKKVIKAHSSAISAVQFSPTGGELLTASWDKTLRVWNVKTGEQLRMRMGIAFPIYSATFDASGTFIAFTNDAQAMLWNWRDGAMKSLALHKRRIFATAAFGEWFATAGEDRVIKQIHFKTNGARIIEDEVAVKIAYRPDGKLIAAAGQDGRARLYDAQTGKKLEVINAHRAKINAVAFSPDGKELYTASADSLVKVWDLRKYD